MTVEQNYNIRCNNNSDICQHMPTLRMYAEQCSTIVELGVRSIVSTWAFLAAKPVSLICVDIRHPSEYRDHDPNGCDLNRVEELAFEQGTAFEFILADSRYVNLPLCDLMFFDTVHSNEHLTAELSAHAGSVKKFLVFHDTETFRDELMPAIDKFLDEHPEWELKEVFTNNNGLTILKRV